MTPTACNNEIYCGLSTWYTTNITCRFHWYWAVYCPMPRYMGTGGGMLQVAIFRNCHPYPCHTLHLFSIEQRHPCMPKSLSTTIHLTHLKHHTHQSPGGCHPLVMIHCLLSLLNFACKLGTVSLLQSSFDCYNATVFDSPNPFVQLSSKSDVSLGCITILMQPGKLLASTQIKNNNYTLVATQAFNYHFPFFITVCPSTSHSVTS